MREEERDVLEEDQENGRFGMEKFGALNCTCLLYTSDAADE